MPGEGFYTSHALSELSHVDQVVLFPPGLSLPVDPRHADKPICLYCQGALCLDQCLSWDIFSHGVLWKSRKREGRPGVVKGRALGSTVWVRDFLLGVPAVRVEAGLQLESWSLWDSGNPGRDLGPLGALESLPGTCFLK